MLISSERLLAGLLAVAALGLAACSSGATAQGVSQAAPSSAVSSSPEAASEATGSVKREAALFRGIRLCIDNDSRLDLKVVAWAKSGWQLEDLPDADVIAPGATLVPGQSQCQNLEGDSSSTQGIYAWVELPGGRVTRFSTGNPAVAKPYIHYYPGATFEPVSNDDKENKGSGEETVTVSLAEGESRVGAFTYDVGNAGYKVQFLASRGEDRPQWKNLKITFTR